MAKENKTYDNAFHDVLHQQFDGVLSKALPENMLQALSKLARIEAAQEDSGSSDLPIASAPEAPKSS